MLESILEGNKTSDVKLEILKRNKADDNKENFEKIKIMLKSSRNGKKLGVLTKEEPQGDLVKSFSKELQATEMEQVDISRGIESALSVKDSDEGVRHAKIP